MGNRALKFVRSKALKQMAKRMLDVVLPDYALRRVGTRLPYWCPVSGATPLMEVYVLYHEIESIDWSEKGIRIHRPLC